MRLILTFLFILNCAFVFANDKDFVSDTGPSCELDGIIKKDNIADIQKVVAHKSLLVESPYYFYLETDELEDLQEFKNCIDYTQCGTYKESIVDDPANYRMHIWKSMEPSEFNALIRSCPVKDLTKKLVVRYKDQKGKIIDVSKYKIYPQQQKDVAKKANPAIFHQPSEKVATSMVSVIHNLINTGKISTAENTLLATWGIDLHGYKLTYTGKKDSYAVTQHKDKTIKYGTDWLSETCDFIRMIRHEAEHVAQMKMANSCGKHNFDDHQMRERAAHLNDARFIKTVCPNKKDGEIVRKFCLDRFRKNYMNVK